MSLPRYESYKNSGVKWLMEVPEHWYVVPTRRAFKKRKELNKGMICVNRLALTMNGVIPRDINDLDGLQASDFESYQIFERNDLVFKLIDLQNIKTSRVGIVPEVGIMSPAYIRLEPDQLQISPKYGYWYYTDLYNRHIFNHLGEGVRQTITSEELLTVPFLMPPLIEQIIIASFLDRETAKIDTLVEEQEKLIALLKEKRQAVIFNSVTKGLDSNVPMKDSGIEWLGDVPDHWGVCRIAILFREANRPGDPLLPVLSISIHNGITDDELVPEERDRQVSLIEDRVKYKRVVPNDLAYNTMRAWQGAFGTVSVYGLVSPAYVVAEPIDNFQTEYIEHLLRTPLAIEEMRRFSRGITDFRMRLYWEYFRDLRVCLPPMSEQDEILTMIAHETSRIDTVIDTARSSIELLKERRSALISAAVTGKIDVRNLVQKEKSA